LLGHIGKLVIAQVMPAPYAEVAREAGGWPTAELEEARLGFTSADVSAALLRAWQLPDLVVCAVGFRDRPDALPEGVTDDVRALVRLMRLTSHTESLLCDREKAAPLQAMSRDAARWFDLSEGEIEAFLVGLESGISETAEMLSVRVPADLSHQEIVEKARQQMVNVSLGIAAAGKEAEKKAETDRLTGLPNRAAFDRFLEDQLRERLRGKGTQALGVLLIDIDRFKSVNDTYGHPVGDEVLRMVGGLLARLTRQRAGDMPARYGGEEFAIVAPQSTPFGLRTMAARLRRAIEAETLQVDGRELRVTASFGGACISDVRSMDDGAMLIKIADLHLYKAKEGGRNRSEIHSRVDFPRPG
jgi:diguanylate cyclase (GGDEF)-like protein